MQRAAIFVLSAILTVLFGWLLTLALEDIGDLEGPNRQALRAELVPAEILERQRAIREELQVASREIKGQAEDQELLDESLSHSEATMQQLMDLHRLSLEKGVDPTEAQSDALAESQALFLKNQARSQAVTERVTALVAHKRALTEREHEVERELAVANRPADEEYARLRQKHDYLVAAMKLGLLLPLLVIVARKTHRNRGKRYLPIWIAAMVATFFHVTEVMYEYFPSEVFNYIATTAGILIIIGFLVSVLRRQRVRKPAEVSRKPIADAYSAGRCPRCAFPFKLRPRADASKERAGVGAAIADREPYTCPSCGTGLFEACGDCGSNRHSLLPYCGSCGAEAGGPGDVRPATA